MRRTVFPAALVACVALVTSACDAPSSPADAHARLQHLGTRWLETPAALTYRTLERDAGEATSTHQCLRQYADRATEIHRLEAIRICSGEGTVRFVQDPPRWSMEVSTPDASFTIISTPDETLRCGLDDGEPSACTATGDGERPFEPILLDPDRILESSALGAGEVSRTEDRRIAGVDSECFSVGNLEEGGEQLEWCYASAGTLLSFTAITGLGSFSLLEAIEIEPGVPPTSFDLPATTVGGIALDTCTETSSVVVPGTSNIFGAGIDDLPSEGGGGGTPPPCASLPTSARSIVVGAEGQIYLQALRTEGIRPFHRCTGGPEASLPAVGPDGATSGACGTQPGGTNVAAAGAISGITSAGGNGYLVGVFLPEEIPPRPPPEVLDIGRDYDFTSLSPELRQVFFIGDGRTSDGTVQRFQIPSGAARLYLGFADAWSFRGPPGYYDDNSGSLSVHVRITSR